MHSNLRLKIYLTVFSFVFAIYLLVPTVLNFNRLREAADKVGDKPPWYVMLFPNKQINLGLDLRGGIYLELEVDLQEALEHRSNIIASEIDRYLKSEKIISAHVALVPKTSKIAVTLENPDDLARVRDYVNEYHSRALRETERAPVLLYRLKDEGSALESFRQINDWALNRGGILDVGLSGRDIQVVLAKPTEADSVGQDIQGVFAGLMTPLTPPAAIYFAQLETFQDQLKDETLKQALETIRNRIDRHGVAEPSIQRLGNNRVAIEMPGVGDPDRAIALVKRAGKLEFKLVDESIPADKVKTLVDEVRSENKIPSGFTQDVVDKINEAIKGKISADSEIAFETQYDPMTNKIVGGVPYLLIKKVDVSGEMLSNAQVSVQDNAPFVSLSFNPAGAKAFGDLTSNNIKKSLAIVLDGVVTKAPVIQSAITSGQAQITLGYGDYQALLREAQDLVVVLREGALPASLKEATKTVIGPSLGKVSIESGAQAILIATIVVMLFMALWYKGAGVLADAAVVLNVIFIMACLTLFGATLTLPGLAGIVLTIGMAVDANVIILERIKEELVSGKSVKAAVDAGYANAMSAIVDANITTFLSGVVLYQFGTGPVRGFAVTLMVGILTTMYTAVVLTRIFYDYILSRRNITKLSL